MTETAVSDGTYRWIDRATKLGGVALIAAGLDVGGATLALAWYLRGTWRDADLTDSAVATAGSGAETDPDPEPDPMTD